MTTASRPITRDCHAIVTWLNKAAADGVFPLSPAKALAWEYLLDHDLPCRDSRADALVRQETTRHFTAGFLRGFSEQIRPPVTAVPAVLAAAWVVETRIAAAVAAVYGHSLSDGRIRAEVMISLLGDATPRQLARMLDVDPGTPLVEMVMRLSDEDIEHVGGIVGASLLGRLDDTPARGRALDQILIPGQGIDEVLDATSCYVTGRTAIGIFRRACTDDPTAGAGARITQAYSEAPS